MSLSALESTVNTAFDARDGISTATKGEVRDAVDHALELLDKGEMRVAEREAGGKWKVNQWLKKAVLLSFRLNDMSTIPGGPGQASWWDKVPSKFEGWGENRFRDAGFRAVPGAIVRRSAFIARNVVLMPSFVNLGAARRSASACTFPAASASAACWSRCRPNPSSSRTTASSAPAPKSPRA